MSSILDALERANKAKRQSTPMTAEELAQELAQQRAKREEERRHRRIVVMLGSLVALFAVVMIGLVVMMLRQPEEVVPGDIVAEVPLPVEPAPVPVVVLPVETPEPTPVATPTPEPTPTPTPTPEPTPEPTLAPTARFAANQVVYPAELGITIDGVMRDGDGYVILFDDEMVDIGRKHSGVRPLSVRSGMIEAEVDEPDGTQTRVFIRFD